ncbi:MAG: aldose epimerase [Pseudonocardiaceae bacterium]|nr:aldose epimerase [Pseudonocardiaceae bacterium]
MRGKQTVNGRLYELRHGHQRAVVAGVGATLLSWQVDGVEQLLTHDADVMGEGYQGKTILPWPNRIDHGRYTFEGEELQVPINEPDRDTALHGLMSFVEWEPVRHKGNSVTLEYLLHPHYGYPFQLAFQIVFTLDDSGLASTLVTRNVGEGPAPFGTANHAYIGAIDGTIDAMTLRLPASTYYQVNDRLIPTGSAPVDGTKFDFRVGRPIGETVMDTAFTDLARESSGLAVARFSRPGGETIELWMDEGYGYLQVYTDDDPDEHPPRSGIAVEPVTCAPNAFVSGDGLVVLRPGEAHQARFGLVSS